MKYRLILRPEVEGDIAEAQDWYEGRQPGVGLEFREALREARDALIENPLAHRILHRKYGVRWCYVRRFPYRIVYKIVRDCIRVLAVLHAARDDRRWQERAKIDFP